MTQPLPRRAAPVAAALAFGAAALLVHRASAQPAQPAAPSMLLTIFLRHDQSRPLPELNAQLEKNGWYQKFPPAGTEVVSWYVMMGVGQVVTLRLPPEKLREVNLAVENAGWGAYRSEFYPTYDFRPVWDEMQKKQRR
ncbi:MAG TPA: hypothetical protein VFP65_08685 [Anaeromyxobacteraceae bacterium]|nr:hypothetical protein [Anaeromyxobacteraceae bacterium]